MCIHPSSKPNSVKTQATADEGLIKDDHQRLPNDVSDKHFHWLVIGLMAIAFSLSVGVVSALTCMAVVVYLIAVFFPKSFGTNYDRLDRWETSQRRLLEKELPEVTLEDFRREIAQGKQWTVLDGHVVDLERLGVHPGGDYLNRFVGRDLTPWFLIQHVKNTKVLKFARHCTVARLPNDSKRALLCSADQEYLQMHEQVQREGMFDVRRAWIIRDWLEMVGPMVFGTAAYFLAQQRVFGILCIAAGAGRGQWFYHDIMHYSVFDSAAKARWWASWPFVVLSGMNEGLQCGDQHAIHHAFPNVIGLDGALEMGPIKVHPAQGLPSLPKGGQNLLFYGIFSFLTYPYYALSGLFKFYQSHSFLFSVILRTGLTIAFWQYLGPQMIGCFLGSCWFPLVATLNHFHMDMGTADDLFPLNTKSVGNGASFSIIQTQTNQNHQSNTLTDNAFGHLTLHIEHHLFPHVHRRRYAALTGRVQRFLQKYSLDYNMCSQATAISKFNAIIYDPVNRSQTEIKSTGLSKVPTVVKSE